MRRAVTVEIDSWSDESPWTPPYTVDTLFELPDIGLLRFEVLGGNLVVSAIPPPAHSSTKSLLFGHFLDRLPADVSLLFNVAVGLPDNDGAIPDMVATTVDLNAHPKWLPAGAVHTVFEVVSPLNAFTDRWIKSRLYETAGIPCYWRIEEDAAIVVRLRDKDGDWRETIAAAGAESELPVVVDANGTVVTVTLDPATLAA